MEKIGERIIYCEKYGYAEIIDDEDILNYIEEDDDCYDDPFECFICKTRMKFWEHEEIVSCADYNLVHDEAFLRANGYESGWSGRIDYRCDLMQKMIDGYISKLPTFDPAASEARLENRRKRKEELRKEQENRRDINYRIQEQIKEEKEARKEGRRAACNPICPTCGSTNVKPISGLERASSIIGFGLFSKKVGKSYKCLNCKFMW